jgi:hypothetical protein
VVDDLLLLGQLDHGLVRIDRSHISNLLLVDRVLESATGASWWSEGALVPGPRSATDVAIIDTDATHFTGMALMLAEASVAAHRGVEVSAFRRGARAGFRLTAPDDSDVVRSVWRPFLHHHALPGSGMGLAVARGIADFLGIALELRDDEARQGLMSLVLITHIAG